MDKEKLLSPAWPASVDTGSSEQKNRARELLKEAKAQQQTDSAVAEKLLLESLRSYPTAETYYELGNLFFSKAPEDGVQAYSRAAEMNEDLKANSLYNIACIRSLQGRFNEADEYLEKAAKAGYKNWKHALSDPDLAALRQDKWRSFWRNLNLMRLGQNTFHEPEDFVGFIGVNDAAGTPIYHLFCPDGRYFTDNCFLTDHIDRGKWWIDNNSLKMETLGECEVCRDRLDRGPRENVRPSCAHKRVDELISSRCMENLNRNWSAKTYGDELLPILRCRGDLELTPFKDGVPEICNPKTKDLSPEMRWKLLQEAYKQYPAYGS